jgi:hypothetical protein
MKTLFNDERNVVREKIVERNEKRIKKWLEIEENDTINESLTRK